MLDVLRNVQDKTGVLFFIDPSLKTPPFNAHIQADNLEAAISDLLKRFSQVGVWTDNLTTSGVWLLLGGRNVEPSPNIALTTNPQTPQSKRRASPPRQKQQRFRSAPKPAPVANYQIRPEELPPHILFEPRVFTFYKSKGIALPNKVKSILGTNLEVLWVNMVTSHISS